MVSSLKEALVGETFAADPESLKSDSLPEDPVAPFSRQLSRRGPVDRAAAAPQPDDAGWRLLDGLPIGVVLFDPEQNVRYANAFHRGLLGRDIRDAGMEAWLRAGCRDEAYAEAVVHQWREYLWQKQLNRVLSLKNGADHLREIEFHPRLLDNGDLLLTIRDVTEVQQVEDALRLTETKLRAVFRHVGTGVALVDRTGRFIDANPALERLLGRGRGELIRLGIADCVCPEDFALLRDAERTLEAGAIQQGQVADPTLSVRLKTREKGLISARVTLTPVTGALGTPLMTALFVEKEDDDESADVLTGSLFRRLKAGVIIADLRGRIRDCNPAAESLFGRARAEMLDQGMARLYAAPGTEAAFNGELSRALTEKGQWESRCPFFRKDGTAGEAEVAIYAVVESGTPRSLVCIHREIEKDRSAVEKAGGNHWRQPFAMLCRLSAADPGDRAGPLTVSLKIRARLRALGLLHDWAEQEILEQVPLADYTRRLAGELLQLTTEARAGASARFKIRADESILADFETATLYGLLVTELALASLILPTDERPPQLCLSLYDGHPRLDLSTDSRATASVAEGVLRILAGDLRASLRLEHREGRAQWLVRFPLAR